jgi:GGDEF domain-containing protein
VAEAVRRAIADTTIKLRHGAIKPTASIGAAFLDEATGDAEVAFADADAAMYLDKTQSHSKRGKATPRTRRRASQPQASTDEPVA